GEPVDLLVNGQHFARGEIVVMDESARTFGVTLTDITPRK
ncbi:MAG: FliM/FliN family flagellar motor switch protein, partial [Pseudomonadota bacterium]